MILPKLSDRNPPVGQHSLLAGMTHNFQIERESLLALSLIRGVGYWTLWRMASVGTKFSSVLNIESGEDANSVLRKFGARLESEAVNSWKTVRSQILARASDLLVDLERYGTKLILSGEDTFPSRFGDLNEPPYWLFVRGDVQVLRQPSISIVGTREPSRDGLWLTYFVGACLSIWRAPTVSGLAAGVDQTVHEMSVRAGVPTIAVLGTGITSDYPKGSNNLKDQIIDEGGAIITEYLPRDSYSAENFVRRNRIQAALGKILIPVEWSARSGTAHTVRYATALARPVACLRMIDWDGTRVPFRQATVPTGTLFTIPGEEEFFRSYVGRVLKTEIPAVDQPDLFGDN
jgi:DNA protecting protein DprA